MKIGDSVKIVATHYRSDFLQNGNTGVVSYIFPEGIVKVKLDSGIIPEMLPDEHDSWSFYPEQLEVTA